MSMSLPKKLGADISPGEGGEWGGYYYQVISPAFANNWAGTNEFSTTWVLPVLSNYTDFSEQIVLMTSSGSFIANGAGYDPVDSQPRVSPTLQPWIDQNGPNSSESYNWTHSMYLHYALVRDNIVIDARRATDFFGFYVGSLTWALNLSVSGILWLRGTFDIDNSYVYTP